MIGIYSITNKINGKRYIGQSIDIDHRWDEHKGFLESNSHWNNHLQSSYNKYGAENFLFEVLESSLSRSDLNSREIYWISHYSSNDPDYGYNQTAGGGGMLGYIPSEETRQKLRENALGNEYFKGHSHTEEWKIMMSNKLSGRKFSDETRKKMSESAKGRKLSDATKKKISAKLSGPNNYWYGKHLPQEVKDKLSKSHTGIKMPEEFKKARSIAYTGEGNPNYGKPGISGRTAMTNGKIDIYAKDDEIQKYLAEGYKIGRREEIGRTIAVNSSKWIYIVDGKEFIGWTKARDYVRSLGYPKFSQTALDKLSTGTPCKNYPGLLGRVSYRRLTEGDKIET